MIHFSINKNLFLQALNTTKRAISSKNAIPILSTVKIDVTNEGVTLIGSNGQISIENFISQKNEDAGLLITSLGSILLEASFFINVVSSLPDVTLDFKEIEQNQIVCVLFLLVHWVLQPLRDDETSHPEPEIWAGD